MKTVSLDVEALAQLIDTSPAALFAVDKNRNMVFANDGYAKMFGYTVDELLGVNAKLFHVDDEHYEDFAKLAFNLATKGVPVDLEYPARKKDGTIFWIHIVGSYLKEQEIVLWTMLDITKRKEAQEKLQQQQAQLHYQAHHDTLTSLPNRMLFNDRLEHAIKKAKRHKKKIALFFIDLDHFKAINDSLGHNIGDQVLIKVTKKLKNIIREEDTLARLGGDEFTIIIEDVTNEQNISLLASKIIKTLSKPIKIQKQMLYVSSSIGISIYPDNGKTAANLLKYADSAMYKAKDEGRNNFQFYSSEMTENAFEQVVMQTSIAVALKQKEFSVYYQPQIDAKKNIIVGMEALARWNHPQMGLILPSKFISLAESTGFIVELDRYIINAAIRDFRKFRKKNLYFGRLSLNLSTKQLRQKDFIEFLQKTMQQNNFKPSWLELEVTESQIMQNPQEAIETLKRISSLGVKIAVDDFGTGYSSLSYLKKLPIDKLKIDKSFVQELPQDKESVAIIQAIIALAKALNLELMAEGVENKAQKDFMIQNGCNYIQGYYFSKPIARHEVENFIKNRYTSNKHFDIQEQK